MSQAYRLLREGMPEPRGGGDGRFHADAKKVRTWIAALPRANAQATQQELAQALESLAGQKLDSSQRLGAMEELRDVVVESIGLLQQQYAGSPLPLPPQKAQAAFQAEAFHRALADGYRRAAVEICAPAGNIPMMRGGSVGTALARAAWHYSRALVRGLARVSRAGAGRVAGHCTGCTGLPPSEARPQADRRHGRRRRDRESAPFTCRPC